MYYRIIYYLSWEETSYTIDFYLTGKKTDMQRYQLIHVFIFNYYKYESLKDKYIWFNKN